MSSLSQFASQYQQYSQALSQIQQACQKLLPGSPGQIYLSSRVAPYQQKHFQFGFFPTNEQLSEMPKNSLLSQLGSKLEMVFPDSMAQGDYRVDTLKSVFHCHNLVFPCYDLYGNVVSLIGRTLLNEEKRKEAGIQKYKYFKGPKHWPFKKSLHLFGLNEAKQEILKKGNVIIVEGQLDVITCFQYGYRNVVALGGTSFSRYQAYLLKRFTNKLTLMLDNDVEGKRGMEKIVKQYGDMFEIEVIYLPEGYKDIDNYLTDGQLLTDLGE